MTLSQKTKGLILQLKPEKDCCLRAFLYGILLFASSFDENKIRIVSENEKYISLAASLINRETGIDDAVTVTNISENEKYKIKLEDSSLCALLLSRFGYTLPCKTYTIKAENFVCDECRSAFLRGVFLSCGGLTVPESGYHMEFAVSYFNLSRELLYFLKSEGFPLKYTKRASNYIIYCKESDTILDLLTYLGAFKISLELTNLKIERDIRNSCNRIRNCETANIVKTVSSSVAQCEAIKKLTQSGELEGLPEELKYTAELRMKFPDFSLSELAASHEPPVTKSCVSHRLKRLTEAVGEV